MLDEPEPHVALFQAEYQRGPHLELCVAGSDLLLKRGITLAPATPAFARRKIRKLDH
jgi:hypothetical protein